MGLLDDLKKEAENAKNIEAAKTATITSSAAIVDKAMREAYFYVNELFKQLNVLKPVCPRVYDMQDVGRFKGLVQQEYRIEYRTKLIKDTEHFDVATITFKRTSPSFFTVKLDAEKIERFRNILWQGGLKFTSEQHHNERRNVIGETFTIAMEVSCAVEIIGDYENGVVRFKMKNMDEFGPTTYTLEPSAIGTASLEELAKTLIGKESDFKVFNRRVVTPTGNTQFTTSTANRTKYIIEEAPPEAEKKGGFFGSIRSALKTDVTQILRKKD